MLHALHAIRHTRSKQDKPAHFKPQAAKKVMILGLLALVGNTPDAALPAEIAAGLPQLLSGLVRLLMDLKAQQDRAAEAAEEEEEEPDEEVSGGCLFVAFCRVLRFLSYYLSPALNRVPCGF
jgi:hypothetical protein